MKRTARQWIVSALVGLSCLWLTGLAAGQVIPLLPEIPPTIAAAHPQLVAKREALVIERNTLRERRTQHNDACKGVEEGTPEDSGCIREGAALTREIGNHILASEKFIKALSAVQVFDSRTLINVASRNQAVRDLAKLREWEGRLVAKLEEVRGWKGDLNRNAREFEEMRAEARRDILSDLFDHLPVPEGLDLLVDKRFLDPKLGVRIKVGYQTVKAIFISQRDTSGNNSAEQANQILDANRAIRNALVDSAKHKLEPKTKMWLEGLSKAFEATAKLAIGASVDRPSREQVLKTVLSALEVLYPPGGILILGERVGERLMMNWQANKALTSLGNALGDTWNAELYLQQKLDDVRGKIQEVERLVGSGQPE